MSAEEQKKFYETIGYEGEDTSTLTYPKEVTMNLLFMYVHDIQNLVC
jgi:hypothetical protein